MPRTTKKVTEQRLLSQDDFAWSKKMLKKDWNACKIYFDDLYNRISVKDIELEEKEALIEKLKKDIVALGDRVTKEKEAHKKTCAQASDKILRREKELEGRIAMYKRVDSSKETWRNVAVWLILLCICLGLGVCYTSILLFANGII